MTKPKRFPLPKRFSAALSEAAYGRLRKLSSQWGLSNNYLLVVLLENLDEIADPQALEQTFKKFKLEYCSLSKATEKQPAP